MISTANPMILDIHHLFKCVELIKGCGNLGKSCLQIENGILPLQERPATPTNVSLYQPIAHLSQLKPGYLHFLSHNTNLRPHRTTLYALILFLSVNKLKPHMGRLLPIASTPDRRPPRRRNQPLDTKHLLSLPTHSLCKAASRM